MAVLAVFIAAAVGLRGVRPWLAGTDPPWRQ
ncbi:hypothetical protein BN439_1686 [Erwinia amylovora Ea644]|nr:hypothetical protein BN439_1686 [Erwinia amylovora Ea644]CCP06781.1 hypothetical protein BN440_1749 [Erwinia amylovora MR1]